MVTITLCTRQQKRHWCLMDSVGEGEGGMIWENGMETCIISYKEWIASPGLIQDPWGWCTGMTRRDGMGREGVGGFWMGNTCMPVEDSCWCVAEPIQYCKVKNKKKKKQCSGLMSLLLLGNFVWLLRDNWQYQHQPQYIKIELWPTNTAATSPAKPKHDFFYICFQLNSNLRMPNMLS